MRRARVDALLRAVHVAQAACIVWLVVAVSQVLSADPAAADNCSVFTDCFGQTGSAAEAAFGLALLSGLSLVLDFVPIVGDVKGVAEAITGRDLLTGQELEPWERALGLIPLVPLADVAKLARHADEFADLAGAARHTDDVADIAGGGRHADDLAPGKLATTTATDSAAEASSVVARGGEATAVNSVGRPYPKVFHPGTGEPIHFPGEGLSKVPVGERVPWGGQERGGYIKEWYDRGLSTPEGGWKGYDIHHIVPREYGGTNAFENLAPVERSIHQTEFNPWWRDYAR